MLEPKLDFNFNPDRPFGKEKNLKAMKQKLRKETRGAMKELRKDAKFIGRFVILKAKFYIFDTSSFEIYDIVLL